MRRTVLFTDLDGTLLDAASYSFHPPSPETSRFAVRRKAQRGFGVMFALTIWRMMRLR